MGNEALTTLKTFHEQARAAPRQRGGSGRSRARRAWRPTHVDRAPRRAGRHLRRRGDHASPTASGTTHSGQAVEQQIAAFKELHPNITIEPQVVPWYDYWTKLQTGVAGGSTYDVFWMNATEPAGLCRRRARSCRSSRMVDDGSIDADAYPESLRSIYTFDGQGLRHPARLRHHRPLLQQGPLRQSRCRSTRPADWTWDDLRAAAEKLTIKTVIRTQWGYASSLGGQQNYYNLIKQNEGEILNADQTESMLGEPAACEALQFAGDFIADGLSPSVAVMQANDPHEMLFPAGVIAMIFGGSWNSLTFSQSGQDIAVAPLPKGKTQASAIHGLANVVWTGSQNQCAAHGVGQVPGLGRRRAHPRLDRHRYPGHARSAGRVGGLAAEA